jgi:molybdopterin-guanine dinucleotide biosynthesis protein A
MAEKFAAEIEKGNYKIHDILKKCDTLYFDEKYSRLFDENLTMFTNINYKTDLEMLSC